MIFRGRFLEFFESEGHLSMPNLSAFIATLTIAFLAVVSLWIYPAITVELAAASAALGGVTVGVNKFGNVWQNIRYKQADNGIQPAPVVSPAPPPTVNQNINVGDAKP